MPARRHRYGGGYGYRRRRRVRHFAVLAVVVLAAAAAGLWITRKDSPGVVVARCPTPSPAPVALVLPAARTVKVQLLNGTTRNGLAAQVADELRAGGFVVLSADNAPAAVGGASQLRYGVRADAAAKLLSFHVPGSVLVADRAVPAGVVAVVLGSDFRRLATPAELQAALRAAQRPAVGARPTGPTPTPTCAK